MTVEIEYRSSHKIQITITFCSDVQLSPVIYLDTQNWKQKLWAHSNKSNFWHGCPIELFNNSRHSKLKIKALSKFKGP